MSKEIAIKFENQLSKHYLQTIQDLLEEQEINPQQFMQMAVNQVKRNSKLLEVFKNNPSSVFSSILTCAEFGLSPTSQMGEAWLIPYGNECQFQIGYQGLTKILYKNPDVHNITAECVFENDEFEYELGLVPKLTHKPHPEERGKLTAVYCVVRFANQEPIFKVMSMKDLKEIQNLSKAGNRSIWFSKTDPQYWMLKKTVFKQLCKLLPKHLNMTKVVSYDNIVEGGGSMRLDEDNNAIVIEEETKTRADKFINAMKEDKDGFSDIAVDVIDNLKKIDPSVSVGKIYDTKVVEEKTEKKHTKEEMKIINEDLINKKKVLDIEKCPISGVDAIGVSFTKPIENEQEKENEDDDKSINEENEIREDETSETIREPNQDLPQHLEENSDFKIEMERRNKKEEAQGSLMNLEVSDEIDVEL